MPQRDIPIIDAHHHFWDLSLDAQEWLCRPPWLANFRYGDYAAIRRDFLHADYAAATVGFPIAATVTMEAEWDEHRLIDETAWTEMQHRVDPLRPAAHVARTFLHLPDAPEALARQAACNLVRGIRHKPRAALAPDRIEPGAPAGMTDPAWRRGRAVQADPGRSMHRHRSQSDHHQGGHN